MERGVEMPYKEKAANIVEQPLFSTGTQEAGFHHSTKESKVTGKPKIGEQLIGEKNVR